MKKHKKQKHYRFKVATSQRPSQSRVVTMRPEDLVAHIQCAEKKVLPLIKEIQADPAAAYFLLAQRTYILTTGSNQLLETSAMNMANIVLSLWKDGIYVPSPGYPFTLEETLQDIQAGLKPTKDYADSFQDFIPLREEQSQGKGQIASGIVKHPETGLWQIWVIVNGPCSYLGAYHDPEEAQRHLQEVVQVARRGGSGAEIEALYEKTLSQGDGLPKQIPFDMMEYLIEHIHLYVIRL